MKLNSPIVEPGPWTRPIALHRHLGNEPPNRSIGQLRISLKDRGLFMTSLLTNKTHHGGKVLICHILKIPIPKLGIRWLESPVFRVKVATTIAQPHVISSLTQIKC